MKNLIVLDTSVLIWSLLDPEKLSKEINHKIEIAQRENSLIISSMTLWEIAMLASKKRVCIYEPIQSFLREVGNIDGLTVQDISPEIAAESVSLIDNFHGDPADRLIVATARIIGATLFTRDEKILDWAKLGHLKTVEV